MAYANANYLQLKGSYLFSEIAKRVAEYSKEHPNNKIIRLGIGDVTLPIVPSVIQAIHAATDEMANAATFRGYGPEQGYDFLRETIAKNDFQARGIDISADEIFVSDGAKSDMGNIGDIFCVDNIVAITDPVYPVYMDTNVMAGRKIVLLECTEENGFIPQIPQEHVDIIYLCSPNNPTGTVLSREQLCAWVEYARREGATILFDAAYEAFITDDSPRSIFEIAGAKEVAIEFRSFSKTAGFTGMRCGYAAIPKELKLRLADGGTTHAHALWNRRHTTKFNGTPYIVQRGAAAIYSDTGKQEVAANIAYYLENARIIKKGLDQLGYNYVGGDNAPYIWLKCPDKMSSWEFFDMLLHKASVVGTPGQGFGNCGEGWFRLTAFGARENTIEAVQRFEQL